MLKTNPADFPIAAESTQEHYENVSGASAGVMGGGGGRAEALRERRAESLPVGGRSSCTTAAFVTNAVEALALMLIGKNQLL